MSPRQIVAVSTLLGLGLFLSLTRTPYFDCFQINEVSVRRDYVQDGQALLHAIPREMRHWPLATVSAAFLGDRTSQTQRLNLVRFIGAATWLLLIVTAALLGGWIAGLSALGMNLFWPGLHGYFTHPQSPYVLIVLLVAATLVWREQSKTLSRTAAAALAIGVSFLYRSPLALLPPILAVMEFRRTGRRGWRQVLILGVSPYLALLPWAVMQGIVFGRFALFERGVSQNMVTGVLGMDFVLEGNWRVIAAGAPESGLALLLWILREAASHPSVYFQSAAARLGHAFSLQPALFGGAVLSAALNRKRPGVGALGLLAVYFLGTHIAFSIKDEYLSPLWPLLAAITAALPAAYLKMAEPRRQWVRRLCAGAVPALLGAASVAGGAMCLLLIRYAWRAPARPAQDETTWRQALARDPRDAWLWDGLGEVLLARNDTAGAEGAARKALELNASPERELRWAWLRAVRMDGKTLEDFQPPAVFPLEFDSPLLKAHAAVLRGNPVQAQAHLAAALFVQDATLNRLGAGSGSDARRAAPLLEPLIRRSLPAVPRLAELLSSRPLQEQIVLIRMLGRMRPENTEPPRRLAQLLVRQYELAPTPAHRREALESLRRAKESCADASESRQVDSLSRRLNALPGTLLERAQSAFESGRRDKALETLGQAQTLDLGASDLRQAARLYRRFNELPRALAILDGLASQKTAGADVHLERAQVAFESGRRGKALKALQRARTLDPSASELRQVAGLYRSLNELPKALAILDALVCEKTAGIDIHLEHAQAAFESGRRESALRSLQRAPILDLNASRLRQVADLYRRFGELERVLPMLDEWLKKNPAQTGLKLDRAEILLNLGRRRESKELLRQAAASSKSLDELRRAARGLQSADDLAGALHIWEDLRRTGKATGKDYSDKAVCEYLLGNQGQALRDLQKALSMSPELLDAYASMGMIYLVRGEYGEALKIYERAPKTGPEHILRQIEEGRKSARFKSGAAKKPSPPSR